MLSFLIRKRWNINTMNKTISYSTLENRRFMVFLFAILQMRMLSLLFGLEFLPDAFSSSLPHVCEQQRLWRTTKALMRRFAWAFAVRLSDEYPFLTCWLFFVGWWYRTWGRFLCIQHSDLKKTHTPIAENIKYYALTVYGSGKHVIALHDFVQSFTRKLIRRPSLN